MTLKHVKYKNCFNPCFYGIMSKQSYNLLIWEMVFLLVFPTPHIFNYLCACQLDFRKCQSFFVANAGILDARTMQYTEYQQHFFLKSFANDMHFVLLNGLLRKSLPILLVFYRYKSSHFSQMPQTISAIFSFAKKI